MVYLGSLLAADGQIGTELARRLGMAMADFEALERVWKHASISKSRKIKIYNACVLQKLMYCMETTWLTASATRKLDGFHARCLRKICKIPHPYLSRVSNAQVLHEAEECPLSATLRHRQLQFFRRIALMSESAALRRATFQPGSTQARRWPGVRRQGRPRDTWAPCVRTHAVAAAGGEAALEAMLQNTTAAWASWTKATKEYCFSGRARQVEASG